MGLQKIWNTFLDSLFVKDVKCIICGSEMQKNHHYCICNACFKTLPFITKRCSVCGANIASGVICTTCKQRVEETTTNISVFDYKFPINHLITSLKYENKPYLAPYLSSFLVDKYIENGLQADYIIPVPMNRIRLKERGFNQAELLCVKFDKIKIPVNNNIVERIINTPNQATLTKQERLTNLNGAFRVTDKSKVKGKKILIVDDVYTTGSTINEIAKVLHSAGAKEVIALTLSHGENRIVFEKSEPFK